MNDDNEDAVYIHVFFSSLSVLAFLDPYVLASEWVLQVLLGFGGEGFRYDTKLSFAPAVCTHRTLTAKTPVCLCLYQSACLPSPYLAIRNDKPLFYPATTPPRPIATPFFVVPPSPRRKNLTPYQVAALSQRRSEQANSASGASAATTKGPLLSPGLSSTQSDRSGVSLGSNGVDDVPDDRDAELTDPFDELQAFFAGASLTDGPSSDGRKPASLKVRRRVCSCFDAIFSG